MDNPEHKPDTGTKIDLLGDQFLSIGLSLEDVFGDSLCDMYFRHCGRFEKWMSLGIGSVHLYPPPPGNKRQMCKVNITKNSSLIFVVCITIQFPKGL